MPKVIPVRLLDRTPKAKAIAAIVQRHRKDFAEPSWRILDVGCGNGDIITYMSGLGHTVAGVDVEDFRRDNQRDFDYCLVDSTVLPFADASFDLIISNHVIEHVDDQAEHVDEMRRCLATDGIIYLSTPNRNSPLMGGHIGNTRVFRIPCLIQFLRDHGFHYTDYSVEAAKQPATYVGRPQWSKWLPRPVLSMLHPWFPAHMFILECKHGCPAGPRS